MISRLFLVSIPVFFLTLTSACADDPVSAKPGGLQPEEQHQQIFQTSIQLVATYHYNKLKIDDDFSSKAFDNYIKRLDPSRVYFLQSDLDGFEKYRYTIDDAVFNGGPQMAYDIFNVYRERLLDRIDFASTMLKDSFDFRQNDSFESDRENSPWCKDFAELDQLWRLKVKSECLSFAVYGKYYASYSESVKRRYDNLKNFSNKTKSEDVFQLFMNSIFELADPHTNYFSPRSAEDFNQSMSLSLEGIGAQLTTENQFTKVAMIIKGGPADKSKKILAGDKITAVGQGKDSDLVNVVDWRLDDVVALIRGKKGTTVRLEIIPATEPDKKKIIELVRDKIVLEDQAAKSSIREVKLNGKKAKVGVVSLPAFYIDFAAAQRGDPDFKSTTRDVKRLIAALKKEKIAGLVIDLRNNGGGSLKEAIDLTGLFIPQGTVVQVKDQNGNIREERDYDDEVFYDGPLTVLVNRFSASASEIFSAAIQDYHRGIVIGERTYGKGTVQDVVDLKQFIRNVPAKKLGQVNLTVAKFYRVNGGTTQHNGVTPDIHLPGIYDDPKFGEDASPYALQGDQIRAAEIQTVTALNKPVALFEQNAKKRLEGNPDYQYLLEDIARLKELDAQHYETLNLEKLKAENDREDKLKKEREAERKKRAGKDGVNQDLMMSLAEQTIGDLLQR